MQIQQTTCPNFTVDRKGRKIIAIVNHITAGLMPGTLSWLRNPAAKASAHYLVTKVGEIYQLVKDTDTAWHAGIVNKPNWSLYDGTNPNRYTIGIEHEAQAGEALTEAQYQVTLWLHRQLVQKWGIPVDHEHIIGHYQLDSINRKNDPGPGFPWDRLFKDLLGQQEQQTQQVVYIQVAGKTFLGVIINNVSYAPIRTLAENLGLTVEWDAQKNTALIPPVNVQVPVSQSGTVQIATGAVIFAGLLISGKTYAPIRQLSEALGHKVAWNGGTNTVIIV